MMHFLTEYGLFLAKITTIVIAIIIVLSVILSLSDKLKDSAKTKLRVKKLNKKYEAMADAIQQVSLCKQTLKTVHKQQKQAKKAEKKLHKERDKLFVLRFAGDIKASAVEQLREEITAVLTVATIHDEILVCIESGGGMVHTYGLAASQLQRIRDKQIPLTVSVDKIAASGGYLMACVADRIIAAPFAIIGSIGVVAQIPNVHRLLKKQNIDYEQITAGEYKRTLSIMGENTAKGRAKVQEDIEEIHTLFKDFIAEHRPHVNLPEVATGEHWMAKRAQALRLVDELGTSDDYLLEASEKTDILEVCYHEKLPLSKRICQAAESSFHSLSTLRANDVNRTIYY